jgi:rhomboid protease GluP
MSLFGTPAFLSALSFLSGRITLRRMDAPSEAQQYARIAARSQRQAMDWSLVLASQDIHPIIAGPGQPAEQSEGWALLVAPTQYEAALAAIRQYRLENRGWSWRTSLPGAELEIHAGALAWCGLLVAWHWIWTFIDPLLNSQGQMSSVAVARGEWFRIFTAVLLHSDLAHLFANVTCGGIFLGLAMARFGWGVTLLATFIAGALGNVMGYTLYDAPYRGVGASGMMMGALGLLCVHSLGLWRKNPKAARYVFSGVIAGVLLFVLFGFSPGTDILAHLGGFLAGLVFGGIMSLTDERRLQNRALNLSALALVIVIIAVTWGLALR